MFKLMLVFSTDNQAAVLKLPTESFATLLDSSYNLCSLKTITLLTSHNIKHVFVFMQKCVYHAVCKRK